MLDKLNGKFGALTDKLGLANLGANSTILGIVKNTNDAVRSTSYGLEAARNFAGTAWKATQADKILNGITTAMVIHNAFMLSSNLGQTIGDVASVVLDAIGIKDETDNPIDVNSVIKAKLTSMISSFIGEEAYASLTAKLAKANRTYQATANVLYATRELFDSARATSNTIVENTGQIGNALREAAVVPESAYGIMTERVTPLSPAQRRFDKFRETLEVTEDTVSVIGEISSEVVETKENFTQLNESWEQWEAEVQVKKDEKQLENEADKLESQTSAEPTDADFSKVNA